jgi:GxxExxY protein
MKASDQSTVQTRDPLTEKVIGVALDVHKALSPGLLESAYSECSAYEFSERGMRFKREVSVPVNFNVELLRDGIRRRVL